MRSNFIDAVHQAVVTAFEQILGGEVIGWKGWEPSPSEVADVEEVMFA